MGSLHDAAGRRFAPRQWFPGIPELNTSQSIPVADSSQVSAARRSAAALARSLSFNETCSGSLSIVVTEAATNLLKHGGGGEIILRESTHGGIAAVSVLALDKGPGCENTALCLQDGFSTAGSAGTGLGAIKRLSDAFDFHSHPGTGTALFVKIASQKPNHRNDAPIDSIGGISLPKSGETESGDAWAVYEQPQRQVLMVADGLGHGPFAAEAARAAVAAFEDCRDCTIDRMMDAAKGTMIATRGGCVAISEVDHDHRGIRFCGIGNIAGVVARPDSQRSMVSLNGTVGRGQSKSRIFEYPWEDGNLLVMHSDGLQSQWSISKIPGLFLCHPELIAGVLYRDYTRGRDDVSVVVARLSVNRGAGG